MIVNVHLHVRDALVVPCPRDLTLDRQTLFEVVGLSDGFFFIHVLVFFIFTFTCSIIRREEEAEREIAWTFN